MILRGRTEIVSAMMLIGAVVVGIAFAALAVLQVSNVVAQGQVQQHVNI